MSNKSKTNYERQNMHVNIWNKADMCHSALESDFNCSMSMPSLSQLVNISRITNVSMILLKKRYWR